MRKVNGGALDHTGSYLGKTIRWVYSDKVNGYITYKTNGNKVPRSDGALAVMELPDEIPAELNRQWYIDEAKSMLKDIGYESLHKM